MPRRQEPKKDAVSCEKSARKGTRGTETSKYPEEKKSNEMPTVAASEEGRAQTCKLRLMGVED